MAFTQEDQEKLAIATQSAQEVANDVAKSETVAELVKGVSKRTKLIIYIVGDTLLGLGLLAPNIAVASGWANVVQVVALSGVLIQAGSFLLVMFGIYKSKK